MLGFFRAAHVRRHGRPVANAGRDQTVRVPHDGSFATSTAAVILDGSGSYDLDGDTLSYDWNDGQGHTATGAKPTLDLPVGTWTFTLTVTDTSSLYRQDTVTITVLPELNAAPVTYDFSVSLNQDTSTSITLAALDPDGDDLLVFVSNPAHGTLAYGPGTSLVYTPTAGYYGPDSFDFFAMDPYGVLSNSSTASITVIHVNHPPVANNQSVTTHNAVSITLTATDADGDGLAYSIVSGSSHGTLTGTAPNLTYTPVANYSGADSFTFKANDSSLDSNAATVSITVANTAPKAVNDAATTRKATAVTIAVLANDSDADGDALTISSIAQPTNGAVVKNANNTLTFTPDKRFVGTTSFSYTISDGHGGTATATVTVTVTK